MKVILEEAEVILAMHEYLLRKYGMVAKSFAIEDYYPDVAKWTAEVSDEEPPRSDELSPADKDLIKVWWPERYSDGSLKPPRPLPKASS